MALKRKALIFGNAILFAAPGCDSTGSQNGSSNPTSDMLIARDVAEPQLDGDRIPDSTPMVDVAHPQPDGASNTDANAADDMAVADAASPADMGSAADGASPGDAAPVADATADTSVDAAPLRDMAPIMDMAIVDAAVIPDMAPANACARFAGQACQRADEGCCDNNQVLLVCRGQVLVPPGPNEIACGCETPNGLTQVFCAVPGFVGIHVAGRQRKQARSLRKLLLA